MQDETDFLRGQMNALYDQIETLRTENAELKANLYAQRINRKVHFEELDHDGELNLGYSVDGVWFQIGNQKFHIANSAEGESAIWWHNQLIIAFERFSQSENERLQNNLEAVESDKEKLIAHIELIGAENAKLIAEREQYENHDVYATLYEDAKALIDPHTKASGGELPTSVIQSFEYLFKFWIKYKAEREAMIKQEPYCYASLNGEDFSYSKPHTETFVGHGWKPLFERPLPAQQIDERLDKPARVNATIFRESVSKGLVIEAAQRYYEWRRENPPESDEAFRNKVLDFIDGNQAHQIPEGYEKLLEYWHASRNMYYIGDVSAEKEREYEDRYEKATSAVYAMLSASQPKGEQNV